MTINIIHQQLIDAVRPILVAIGEMPEGTLPAHLHEAFKSAYMNNVEVHLMVDEELAHKHGDLNTARASIREGYAHKVEHVTLKDGELTVVEGKMDWSGTDRAELTQDQWRAGMANIDAVVPTTDEQIQQKRNDAQDARTDKPSPLMGQQFEGTIKGVIDADGNAQQDGEAEVVITEPEDA